VFGFFFFFFQPKRVLTWSCSMCYQALVDAHIRKNVFEAIKRQYHAYASGTSTSFLKSEIFFFFFFLTVLWIF
jgi:tRNA(Arg) A34 adenosine deaminase TadA